MQTIIGRRAFFAEVVAHPDLAERHHYVLLSTNPKAIPPALQAHLAQLGATILAKPFDVDVLLAAVRDAAERVAASSGEDESA